MNDANESSNPVFIGATVPFFVIMVLLYSARIYSRVKPVVNLHWDDFFITLAIVGALLIFDKLYLITRCQVIEIIAYSLELRINDITGGRHIQFINLDAMMEGSKNGFVVFLLAVYANLLIKISIALMLIRIKSNFAWRFGLSILITSCVIISIFASITEFVSCRPLKAWWTPALRFSGACWSPSALVAIGYFLGGE